MAKQGHKKSMQPLRMVPELTSTDLAEQLQSGGSKWTNRIQWVRQRLIGKSEMESPSYGIWAITAKGLARLRSGSAVTRPPSSQHISSLTVDPAVASQPHASQLSSTPPPQSSQINFEETVDDYLTAFKEKLLQKLHDLAPAKFEEFASALLKGYGFQKVQVTGKAGDGGIDGYGELRVGLAVVRDAFQCKRWEGSVGSKEVQAFRGAIQGQFEQGYFFTTSTFLRPRKQDRSRWGQRQLFFSTASRLAR